MCEKRKIVRDGDGFGVKQFSRHYGDWEFLNDEPLPSIRSAREWLKDFNAGRATDWEALRKGWARGFLDVSQSAPRAIDFTE